MDLIDTKMHIILMFGYPGKSNDSDKARHREIPVNIGKTIYAYLQNNHNGFNFTLGHIAV